MTPAELLAHYDNGDRVVERAPGEAWRAVVDDPLDALQLRVG